MCYVLEYRSEYVCRRNGGKAQHLIEFQVRGSVHRYDNFE